MISDMEQKSELKGKSGKGDGKRIVTDLSSDAAKILDDIAAKNGITRAAILKRLVDFYVEAIPAMSGGRSLAITDESGSRVEYKIMGLPR